MFFVKTPKCEKSYIPWSPKLLSRFLPISSLDSIAQSSFLSSSDAHLPPMCESVSRKSQSQRLQVPGSLPLCGFRSTDLSRKSMRHRGVSACAEAQALPYGHPSVYIQKQSGKCKQSTRLENLRRRCSRPYQSQIQLSVPANLLSPNRQNHRSQMRSDDSIDGQLQPEGLSGKGSIET